MAWPPPTANDVRLLGTRKDPGIGFFSRTVLYVAVVCSMISELESKTAGGVDAGPPDP